MSKKTKTSKDTSQRDGSYLNDEDEQQLGIAIGSQIRIFRIQLKLTASVVAKKAGVSQGMLSKIERGVCAPSLGTLYALAKALNVPLTSLFRKYEEQRDCSLVRSGKGLTIERHGTREGYQYQLLGHNISKHVFFEPYLVTLSDDSEVFPLFQHTGIEFIYILSGEILYRHSNNTYLLTEGDSLCFDSDAPHGPEQLVQTPIRMIVCIYRSEDS